MPQFLGLHLSQSWTQASSSAIKAAGLVNSLRQQIFALSCFSLPSPVSINALVVMGVDIDGSRYWAYSNSISCLEEFGFILVCFLELYVTFSYFI